MAKKVTLILCDKDSSGVNTRDLIITDREQTGKELDAIFADTDQNFRRYYYELETDDQLTADELKILEDIGLDITDLI